MLLNQVIFGISLLSTVHTNSDEGRKIRAWIYDTDDISTNKTVNNLNLHVELGPGKGHTVTLRHVGARPRLPPIYLAETDRRVKRLHLPHSHVEVFKSLQGDVLYTTPVYYDGKRQFLITFSAVYVEGNIFSLHEDFEYDNESIVENVYELIKIGGLIGNLQNDFLTSENIKGKMLFSIPYNDKEKNNKSTNVEGFSWFSKSENLTYEKPHENQTYDNAKAVQNCSLQLKLLNSSIDKEQEETLILVFCNWKEVRLTRNRLRGEPGYFVRTWSFRHQQEHLTITTTETEDGNVGRILQARGHIILFGQIYELTHHSTANESESSIFVLQKSDNCSHILNITSFIPKSIVLKTTGLESDLANNKYNSFVKKREDDVNESNQSIDANYDYQINYQQKTPEYSESNEPQKTLKKPLLWVDVCAVVDFKLYSKFLSKAKGQKNKAVNMLRDYFSFMFALIDTRYSYPSLGNLSFAIRINIAEVHVFNTADNFVERMAVNGTITRPLLTIYFWLKSKSWFFRWDHVMLFTEYRIRGRGGERAAGVAYQSSICSRFSISAVRDNGLTFRGLHAATHELGHSLSLRHDGPGSPCPAATPAPIMWPDTRSNMRHWSVCSAEYLIQFVTINVVFNRKDGYRKCLGNKLTSSLPEVVGVPLPGRGVSLHWQCQATFGNHSFLWITDDFESICRTARCATEIIKNTYAKTSVRTQRLSPMDGTPCGPGRHCRDGDCEPHGRQDDMLAKCPYGDLPEPLSPPGINMTCKRIVQVKPRLCRDSIVKKYCCVSCSALSAAMLRGLVEGDEMKEWFSWLTTEVAGLISAVLCGLMVGVAGTGAYCYFADRKQKRQRRAGQTP